MLCLVINKHILQKNYEISVRSKVQWITDDGDQ